MKKVIIAIILLLNSIHLFAQNKPSYPEPKEGYKRVDLIFPKIENSNLYNTFFKNGDYGSSNKIITLAKFINHYE